DCDDRSHGTELFRSCDERTVYSLAMQANGRLRSSSEIAGPSLRYSEQTPGHTREKSSAHSSSQSASTAQSAATKQSRARSSRRLLDRDRRVAALPAMPE